ncbi:MAG: glycerophosphodiester phosphodiesterase [Nitrospiraceae bacterium]|nr:MAG: glycerophosphodiester phosphodiesterase [Nitrospiraceae bacterium]
MGFFLPLKAPEIIAHRGASYDAPENTLAAFALAWQQGADGIEGDFHLSKDGKIICIHDATTGRTAGFDMEVAKSPSDRLRTLDVGKWKDKKWTGERIPLIEEVFSTIPDGKKIFIEIKCGEDIIIPLRKAADKSGLKPGQIVIISFSERVIAESKNHMPRIKALWLTDIRKEQETDRSNPSIEQILSVLRNTHADGISVGAHAVIEKAFVSALRKEKKEFHVWNVNETKTAQQFLEFGADSMTTDRPRWLRNILTLP